MTMIEATTPYQLRAHREHKARRARLNPPPRKRAATAAVPIASVIEAVMPPEPASTSAPVAPPEPVAGAAIAEPALIAASEVAPAPAPVPAWVGTPVLAMRRLQYHVARHYGLDRDKLLCERRTANLIIPRHVAMYLASNVLLRSSPAIGRAFGGRDHTTVLQACRKIARLISEDPSFAAEVETLRCELAAMFGTTDDDHDHPTAATAP